MTAVEEAIKKAENLMGSPGDAVILAAEVKRLRRTTTSLATLLLRPLLDERFEDGTYVFEAALALNPDLLARLRTALDSAPRHQARDEGEDDGTWRWLCRYCGMVIPGVVSSYRCPGSPDQNHRRGERWHEPD